MKIKISKISSTKRMVIAYLLFFFVTGCASTPPVSKIQEKPTTRLVNLQWTKKTLKITKNNIITFEMPLDWKEKKQDNQWVWTDTQIPGTKIKIQFIRDPGLLENNFGQWDLFFYLKDNQKGVKILSFNKNKTKVLFENKKRKMIGQAILLLKPNPLGIIFKVQGNHTIGQTVINTMKWK